MASSDSGSSPAYAAPDRWLHRLALGSPAVIETALDIERATFGKAASDAAPSGPPVFVCGLARAGTSLIARLIDGTGAFASLRYRDMPFPTAPNLWARLSRGNERRVAAAERGHGDGMTHDLDTPEALEEAFWRGLEGRRYITGDGLKPVRPRAETLDAYRELTALVRLRDGRGRYLAKNNNHLLRLVALVDAFPDAVLVHPFRDPAAQARSLMAQHRQARAHQAADPFARDYAAWLAHHEFGLIHRPFRFREEGPPQGTPEEAAYWEGQWHAVYCRLLDQPATVRARQVFVDHDRLRADPQPVLTHLANAVGVSALDGTAVRSSGREIGPAASSVHAELRRRAET